MNTKILVAGDLHGVPAAAHKLVAIARETGADEIWQVGDLGYWPQAAGFDKFMTILADAPATIYFADGNHENHYALGSGNAELQPRHVHHNVVHQPRGTVRGLGTRKVMFFGGAQSVDRTYRKEHVSWFASELPNYAEWERALGQGEVDVVVAHEAPSTVGFGYPKPELAHWPTEDLKAAERHRNALKTGLLPTAKPDVWFHGHHHTTRYSNVDGTRYYGLNCDGHPGTFVLFDLDNMAGRFVYMDRHGGLAGVRPNRHVV